MGSYIKEIEVIEKFELMKNKLRADEVISVYDAYSAAYQFLLIHYRRFGVQSDIGVVLGEMQIHSDGLTMDPAVWSDWLKCVDQAKSGEADIRLLLNRDGKTWFNP
jgi:hypothetical protein